MPAACQLPKAGRIDSSPQAHLQKARMLYSRSALLSPSWGRSYEVGHLLITPTCPGLCLQYHRPSGAAESCPHSSLLLAASRHPNCIGSVSPQVRRDRNQCLRQPSESWNDDAHFMFFSPHPTPHPRYKLCWPGEGWQSQIK